MSARVVQTVVVIDADNPWPGLSSFYEGAKPYFHGRDMETAELVRLVGQAALTVLFGASGLGKTSLVQAGLFPHLREQHILPVKVRLDMSAGSAPLIDQLAVALRAEMREQLVDGPPFNSGESLWEYLHGYNSQWWSTKNQPLTPLFFFDQFEELFTLGAGNAAAIDQFRLDLSDLIENRIPKALALRIAQGESVDHLDLSGQRYKMLLSFREDFLPDVEGWKVDLPSIMRNRLRLLPMSADSALSVVTGKTGDRRSHNVVTDETAREIVRFVTRVQTGGAASRSAGAHPQTSEPADWDELEIEPALLSLLCAGLNARRKSLGRPTIDDDLVRDTGPAILTDFYERCIDGVPEKTVRFIEEKLITETGFRNSYPLAEARKDFGLTDDLLNRLVTGRLLRVDQQHNVDRIELIHDRLTEVVRTSRDMHRARQDELLAREDEVRARAEMNRRRLNTVIAILAVAGFVAFGFFAVLYYAEGRRSQIEKFDALLNGSRELLGGKRYDDLTGMVRALEAEEMRRALNLPARNAAQVRGALQVAIDHVKERNRLNVDALIMTAAFNTSGKKLGAVTQSGRVYVWDRAGKPFAEFPAGKGNTLFASFTRDLGKVAVGRLGRGLYGTSIAIWDVNGRRHVAQLPEIRGVSDACIQAQGRYVATGGSEGMRIFDARGRPIALSPNQAFGVGTASVACSDDGRKVAWAAESWIYVLDRVPDGTVRALKHSHADRSILRFAPGGGALISGKQLFDLALSVRWENIGGSIVNGPVDGRPGPLAAGDRDGVPYVVRRNDRTTIAELHGHTPGGYAEAFAPAGRGLLTAGDDRTVRLWDLRLAYSEFSSSRRTQRVAFSKDVQRLVSVDVDAAKGLGGDSAITLWDFTGKANVNFSTPDAGFARKVDVSPNGQFAVLSSYGWARLWDVNARKDIATLNGDVAGVSFAGREPLVVAATPSGANVVDWRRHVLHRLAVRAQDKVLDVTVDPDGKRIIIATDSGVSIWNLDGARIAGFSKRLASSVRVLSSASAERIVLAMDNKRRAEVYDSRGNPVAAFDNVSAMAISPNGGLLATGGPYDVSMVWDVDTQTTLEEYEGRGARQIAFSPDSKFVVIVANESTSTTKPRLWKIESLDALVNRGCEWIRDYLRNKGTPIPTTLPAGCA